MPAIFPRWTNKIPLVAAIAGPIIASAAIFGVWYWFSPEFTDAGYRPEQPVPFSHKLHAGEIGLDCRYCHNTVERSPHAAVPPTQTCMNCHSQVATDAPELEPIRNSYETGESMQWVRVHQIPDYAFFDHRPHLAAGVGCASCHGRIDQMTVVEMSKPLSMGWCLECHRDPDSHLRPLDQITNMTWDSTLSDYDWKSDATRERKELNPPEHCSGCHR